MRSHIQHPFCTGVLVASVFHQKSTRPKKTGTIFSVDVTGLIFCRHQHSISNPQSAAGTIFIVDATRQCCSSWSSIRNPKCWRQQSPVSLLMLTGNAVALRVPSQIQNAKDSRHHFHSGDTSRQDYCFTIIPQCQREHASFCCCFCVSWYN